MRTLCMVGFGQIVYLATTMGLNIPQKRLLSKNFLLRAEPRKDVDVGSPLTRILYTMW